MAQNLPLMTHNLLAEMAGQMRKLAQLASEVEGLKEENLALVREEGAPGLLLLLLLLYCVEREGGWQPAGMHAWPPRVRRNAVWRFGGWATTFPRYG